MAGRLLDFVATGLLVCGGGFACGGCFIGDRVADRTLTVYQYQTTGSGTGPFPVDVSPLPPGAVERRMNEADGTETFSNDQRFPIRVLLVPVS